MQVNISNGTLTQLQETLSPDSSYTLPNSIAVTGATSNYNSSTGLLVLTNPTSSMSITAAGYFSLFSTLFIGNKQIESIYTGSLNIARMYIGSVKIYDNGNNIDTIQYTITINITDGSYTGATYIKTGQTTATVTLSADTNYDLPSLITVSGANYTYDSVTGVISLNNFTGNVTIMAICQEAKPYLTFSSPSTFTLKTSKSTKNWDGILEYSSDTTTWNEWDGTTILNSSDSGDTKFLYLRGIGNTYVAQNSTYKKFTLIGSNISCLGNIEKLLDYQTVANGQHPAMASACYAYLFEFCSSLIQAPDLPATTLTSSCYRHMFYGCTNLTTPPVLPATTLAPYCYYQMFRGSGLTTPPVLPATTMANYCYYEMFYGCTNLTTAPALPATTLASHCYTFMFGYCPITFAPDLPATVLVESCYNCMFGYCTSLTNLAKIGDGITKVSPAVSCCQLMYTEAGLHIYTTAEGHTPFFKGIAISSDTSSPYYRSTWYMFNRNYINGSFIGTGGDAVENAQYYY